MTEVLRGITEAAPSPGPAIAAVPLGSVSRQSGSKESQPRETTLSATSSRFQGAGRGVPLENRGTAVATSTNLSTKQQSLASPPSPARANSVHVRAPARPGSPSRYHSALLGSGSSNPTKRSPIRVGYLFKQSSGSWKRKRWNQRWFVLDIDTGVLKYFRHESLPEAVPFRQDAHGVIFLKEPGASLVIQGDLPRNVPTPFCFTVCDANRSFLICADSNQDFREWTSAISAILSPRKASTTEESAPKRAATDSALEAVSFVRPALTGVTRDSLTKPKASACVVTENDDRMTEARPSLRQTSAALVAINVFFGVVRFGSFVWLCMAVVSMNVFLVWRLFLHKSSSRIIQNSPQLQDEGESFTDDSSMGIGDSTLYVNSTSKSPCGINASSKKPSSPKVDKQPSKFLGVVNGAKVKAGDSVKSCPPAPAAFVAGCWTQINGTRFQVRQGPNYRKTKLKAPSEESLLDLVAVDIYRSPSKIDNIASIIDLSGLKPADGPLDLFIVNCQVPSYQPSNPLWGEKQGNGEGFNFVCFFAIPPTVREQLDQPEPTHQAIQLLKNFMKDDSTVRDRFKAIGIVVNPQEQKLGRTERHLLETYNGQPILTRPQHRFYRGDGYFEIDVDAHEFNFVARKGLVGVSEHFRNMVVDFGYVVEGQEDSELPEQMLGAVRLCKIDVRQALEIA